MNAQKGKPLIARCCLGAAGGGWWWRRRREKFMEAKEGRGGGDSAVSVLSPPPGRFGTVMMGWGSVWVGVWWCYLPPMYRPPTPPPPLSFPHTHKHTWEVDFVQDGDCHRGPLRRTGCALLTGPLWWVCVCLCVFISVMLCMCTLCVCYSHD